MTTVNVPGIERAFRVALGVGLVVYALFGMPAASFVLASIGACVALTGLIGFCPACAMAGRRPPPR